MFYSRSQNRHKHWYHILIMGHRKLWALGIFFAFILTVCLAFLVVYSIRAAGYDISVVRSGLHGNMLYDSQNHVVTSLSEREPVPVQWNELPQHLIMAFTAREDAHFFDHSGVVYSAVLRSILRNILSMRYKQGASTITMQLTRHVYELQGKTMDRKMLEIMLAQRIENNYDKQTILCQYLSRIFYGQNCYGIREAARFYFGKSVSELNLAESAMLAGIVRAPSLYNPKYSPANARKVRRETLQRMLELEMISQDQYQEADNAPVPTQFYPGEGISNASYPALWANEELAAISTIQEDMGKGISAVSYLLPQLQQRMEQSIQSSLAALETTGTYPEAWRGEISEDWYKKFTTTKRPAWLRPAGTRPKAGEGVLQCCALVLDSRLNHRGNILAVVGGRHASDGINRWHGTMLPGRAIAPLVFCCACLPGGNSHHIVAHSASITGSRLGYPVVRAFFDTLALDTTLPDAAHENDLYDGLIPLQRLELARLLFSLQNMGKGYKPRLISSVWSHGQRLLYAAEAEQTPPEYIRRESASAVSHIPPFRYREGEPITMHEALPENGGYWAMVFNDRGVCVFLWMGVETAPGETPPDDAAFNKLISHIAFKLARDLHTAARQELRALAPAKP